MKPSLTSRLKQRSPDKGKKVGISETEVKRDYDRERPTFCLRFVDPNYCITACDTEDKAAFADKIRRMSQMTWVELRMAPRHGMGSEKINRSAIKRPIPTHIPEDAALLAFRFSGMKEMVGYRMQGMFHIVWFDCDFSLYDHGS
jgi:hypothetical protein